MLWFKLNVNDNIIRKITEFRYVSCIFAAFPCSFRGIYRCFISIRRSERRTTWRYWDCKKKKPTHSLPTLFLNEPMVPLTQLHSLFFYLVWIIWALNEVKTHHWRVIWDPRHDLQLWKVGWGGIRGATDLLRPRDPADKSGTSYKHQRHWHTPHLGQCKHTHPALG